MKEPIHDGQDNPDRSAQYRLDGIDIVNVNSGARYSVVDQLNENFRQLRLMRTALSDRDQVISELHDSIHKRDETIGKLNQKLKQMNRLRPVAYAALGAVVAKFAELGFGWLVFGHH